MFYHFSINKKAKKILLKPQNDNTIKIVVPSTKFIPQAKEFIKKKKLWVEDVLIRLSSAKVNFTFLGQPIRIDRINSENGSLAKFQFRNDILFIDAPEKFETNLLYEHWLKIMSKKRLPGRVLELSRQFNFYPAKISIRKASTRWGSCSSKNNISLNSKLIMFNEKIIDYVIIHELCHTLHHNHSSKFWDLVSQIMPDYKIRVKELKSYRA